MKPSITKLFWLLIILIGGMTQIAHAQGLRYGTLQYRIMAAEPDSFKVEFIFYQEWDEDATYFLNGGAGVSVGDMDTLPNFFFGDGDVIDLMIPVDAIVDGVIKGSSIFEHWYTRASAPYTAEVLASPRTDIISNSANNGFYRIQTRVIEQPVGYDSPSINVSPITTIGLNTTGTFDLFTEIDEDASSDTYVIPAGFESGLFANGNPPFITGVDLNTGLVSYDADGTDPNIFSGIFPFQARIEDNFGGQAVVDFLIEINPCTDSPSWTANTLPDNSDTIITVGTTLTLTLEGTTSSNVNAASTDITPTPLPDGAVLSSLVQTGSTYTATFTWTPTAAQVGTYVFAFELRDRDANGDFICQGNTRTYGVNVNNCLAFDAATSPVVTYNQPPTFQTDYPTADTNGYYPGVTLSADICLESLPGITIDYEWLVDGVKPADGDDQCINLTSVPTNSIAITATWINENTCIYTNSATFLNVLTLPGSCDASIVVNNCAPYGDPNTFYRGYSTGMELMADAGTATGPFSYAWSTGDTTQSVNVVPSSGTTYTVTITDGNGNACTETQFIDYVDLECCGSNKCNPIVRSGWGQSSSANSCPSNRTTVCYNGRTKNVRNSHLNWYLCNGATLGACPPDPCERVKYKKKCKIKLCKTTWWCGTRTVCVKAKYADWLLSCGNYTLGSCNSSNKTETVDMVNEIVVSPNPSTTGNFTLDYALMHEAEVEVQVVDFMGRVVYRTYEQTEEGYQMNVLDLSKYPAGMYVLTIRAFDETWTEKLQIVK